jgi:hypothetical protein
MKWIRHLIVLSLVGISISCATTRSYDDMLGSWVGQEKDTLVDEWGPPSATHAYGDGNLAYEYLSVDGFHSPERIPSRQLTGLDVGCKTIFTINNNDQITGWRREGYNCRY